MRAYALIQSFSGSKGSLNQSALMVAGHPLLAYSVAFTRQIAVERVLLATDSPRQAEIGRAYDAEVPGLRPAAASGNPVSRQDILADLETALAARDIPRPALWVWLDPAYPFRAAAAVTAAITILQEKAEVDAVRMMGAPDAGLQRIDTEGCLETAPGPPAYAPTGLEVLRHSAWHGRGPSSPPQRVHPLP